MAKRNGRAGKPGKPSEPGTGRGAKRRARRRAKKLEKRAQFESALRARAARPSPPAWYVRILPFAFDRDVEPWQFDEDLSDLNQDEKESDNSEDESEDVMSGEESEKTVDGSDAELYYELKDEREKRKREKVHEDQEKDRRREFEITKEDEVRDAYQSLREARKQGKKTLLGPLERTSFNLFCSEHVGQRCGLSEATKRVDFGHLPPNMLPEELSGNVYIDADTHFSFGPFRPPRRASRRPLELMCDDDKHKVSLQLLGNGYLKLRAARELVIPNGYTTRSSADASKEFEFVGIWRDPAKRRTERQEQARLREERSKAVRGSSPRESWFERTHFMGAWAEA